MSTFIRSKYQQYKRDTAKLTTWLATAAVRNGFSLADFDESSQPLDDDDSKRSARQVKNAKKKAKAKAKAKGRTNGDQESEAAKAKGAGEGISVEDGSSVHGVAADLRKVNLGDVRPPEPSRTTQSKSYLIPSHLYPTMAQFLVEQSVHVPVELHQLLDRCIQLRYSCLRRFLKRPDASTVGHAHFIQVLTDVKDIFSDYRDGIKVSSPETKPAKGASSNRFAELEMHDTNEAEELPDIFLPEPPGPTQVTPTPMVFAPEPSREELVIRALAFFEDMHDIRDEIINLWGRYKSGEIDLTTAAVTTNTALELLRASHDDVVKTILPAFDNSLPGLINTIYNVLLFGYTLAVESPPLFQQVDDSDATRTAIYDHLLYPVLQILGGFSDLIVDGVVPVYKPGHFGKYDPTLNFYDIPFSKRWHQSLILISETFTDYLLLTVMGEGAALPASPVLGDEQPNNLFFIDEIAAELDRFSRSKDVNLMVMVYCQIFVDMNFVMGSSTNRGKEELKRGASDMLATLKRRKEVEPSAPSSVWPPENEPIVNMFMIELECWRTDMPSTLMEKGTNGRVPVRCYLFDRNPMLCGLLLFRLRLKYQNLGLRLVNSFGSILATAHLVAACQHSGVLPGSSLPTWADMDVVIDLHGKDDIFGGKYPENVDESLTSFLHMMGYSTEVQGAAKHVYTKAPLPSYLQNPRRKFNLKSKAGPKGLTDRSQIQPIFLGKYVRDPSAGTKFDLNAVQNLLSDIQVDQKQGQRRKQGHQGDYRIRRERKHRSPKFSILQLLSVLETGLEAETTSIRFDYISMHLRCLSLLKKVQLSAHDYFSGKLGPGYLENEAQLPFIVGYILQYAAISGRAAEQIGYKREGRNASDVRSQRLVDATRVVREFLRDTTEGSVEVNKIRR